MPTPIPIAPDSSALVLVDLQVGITQGMSTFPLPTEEVVGNASRLVSAFHDAKIPVIFVKVNYGRDNELQVKVPHDWNVDFSPPDGWDELDPRLGAAPDDTVVTKHVVSAFYGTDLEVNLRRRGIDTLVLGGIATNSGVEATARSAHDRAFTQLFVADAMGAVVEVQHTNTVEQVFPLLGHVTSTADVLETLGNR